MQMVSTLLDEKVCILSDEDVFILLDQSVFILLDEKVSILSNKSSHYLIRQKESPSCQIKMEVTLSFEKGLYFGRQNGLDLIC